MLVRLINQDIYYISISLKRARKNKDLDLAGRTVEYGPLN